MHSMPFSHVFSVLLVAPSSFTTAVNVWNKSVQRGLLESPVSAESDIAIDLL